MDDDAGTDSQSFHRGSSPLRAATLNKGLTKAWVIFLMPGSTLVAQFPSMPWNIYPKEINKHTYYYAQRSRREKIASAGGGKTKGSGKSRVRTETIYLGSAESIVGRLKGTRKPAEVRHREFGFVAAVYQAPSRIGPVRGQRMGHPFVPPDL